MNTEFTSEFFVRNRKRLRELFTGTTPIVISANGLMQRNADMEFLFRQDSNFWYITGISEPDIVLVMDKTEDYLIIPERDHTQEVFGGALNADTLTRRSGITAIMDAKTGWKKLETRLKRVKHVATLAAPPAYVDGYHFYTNPARAALATKIKDIHPAIELLDLRDHFARMRVIKQSVEIRAIQKSVNLTVKTLTDVSKKIATCNNEFEVEAAITGDFRKNGAGHGYSPIVAGGLNACTLHYNANNAVLSPKNLLLIDVGAEYDYYSADITRTYAADKPTARQAAVLEAVREVQDFAFSLLKPKARIKDNEQWIEQFMGEKLRALGLIKTIDHDNVRQFYPHSTSHFLGLDVHDVGDYERPLEAGMVLTVEPGIYIPKENIGVRIEDNVVITVDGYTNLSAELKR